MERLTEYIENGKYIAIKRRKTLYPTEERWNAPATAAIVRLCHYEDSGLTPEEVMELAKIVRCKDCKYFFTESCPMEEVFESCTEIENGFCNHGERKQNV